MGLYESFSHSGHQIHPFVQDCDDERGRVIAHNAEDIMALASGHTKARRETLNVFEVAAPGNKGVRALGGFRRIYAIVEHPISEPCIG